MYLTRSLLLLNLHTLTPFLTGPSTTTSSSPSQRPSVSSLTSDGCIFHVSISSSRVPSYRDLFFPPHTGTSTTTSSSPSQRPSASSRTSNGCTFSTIHYRPPSRTSLASRSSHSSECPTRTKTHSLLSRCNLSPDSTSTTTTSLDRSAFVVHN
jgi:hypothetical protein